MKKISFFIILMFYLLNTAITANATDAPTTENPLTQQFNDVTNYISSHWSALTRDLSQCYVVDDPKMQRKASIQFPAHLNIPSKMRDLSQKCMITILKLPKSVVTIVRSGKKIKNPDGLLYLPHPYIVPGGMFNEMYGWDSYFIIRGLIDDNKIELAKGMVENFFFEIKYYGGTLNGNRVYYLSRSQPPFLSSMVMSIYHAMPGDEKNKRKWLKKAYPFIVKDYELWTNPPHLAGNTGLSRYFDFNDGPVVETKNDINHYYKTAIRYFIAHHQFAREFIARRHQRHFFGPLYEICANADESKTCQRIKDIGLTKKFYRSDRAIRESGMDISFRFGPYGANTVDYAPLDLNSLLYKTERDLEYISQTLGDHTNAIFWHKKAALRRILINKYFWNKSKGLFYDFNFRNNQQSHYDFITTFYPLWIGLATREQANAVKNNLYLFEKKGGLMTSTFQSGAQWDAPYGWAPFHLIAFEGLHRYGYIEDAHRIALAFLNNVAINFRRTGTIREKYNVITESSQADITVGYMSNEIGFGWTNGVFISLLHLINTDSKPHSLPSPKVQGQRRPAEGAVQHEAKQ